MSATQCRVLGELMALQAVSENLDIMRHELGSLMLQYLNADTYSSMLWNTEKKFFERAVGVNETAQRLKSWSEYYRFIDPVTAPMMARRVATTATQILPQHELLRTEFFNDFLRPHNQYWGINIYFYNRDECVGDFRIWRKRARGDFDKDDAVRLNMLAPSMAACLGKMRRSRDKKEIKNDEPLQRLLQLSRREAEISCMIAEGLSDKCIAAALGISVTTVRFHLKNVFSKCRVVNRAGVAARIRSLI